VHLSSICEALGLITSNTTKKKKKRERDRGRKEMEGGRREGKRKKVREKGWGGGQTGRDLVENQQGK
jgi:hypothetical protein